MNPQQELVDKNTIYVIIRNREKIILQERCRALTSTNEKGLFDVLPQHISFISVINEYIILHKIDGTEEKVKINQGIMEVKNNVAYVFLDVTASMQDAKKKPELKTTALSTKK